MNTSLPVSEFLIKAETYIILDVRTPAEFAQGHIPNAVNLPLFSNEERAIVGTLYKQQGREEAFLKGLEFIGGKLRSFLEVAIGHAKDKTILVHCWRGGMRSGSMATLFAAYGLKVFTLSKGYKAFRNWVLREFENEKSVVILGGKTGSAKTKILHQLKENGEQIIDLEALAHHKGSAFGNLGEEPQSTQEQFENNLAVLWNKIDSDKTLWLEDESRNIGKNMIPATLWTQMREAPVCFLDVSDERRTKFLLEEYGQFSKEDLIASIQKITKRLGLENTKTGIETVMEGDAKTVCEMLLTYYDKGYLHGLSKRDSSLIHTIPVEEETYEQLSHKLITLTQEWKKK